MQTTNYYLNDFHTSENSISQVKNSIKCFVFNMLK